MAVLVRRQDLRSALQRPSRRRWLRTHSAAHSVSSDEPTGSRRLNSALRWKRGALAPQNQPGNAAFRPGPHTASNIALILACAFAVVVPLAFRGASCGHDFDFHLQSWLAVAQQWHHGVLYPRWIEGANYGA